MYTLIFSLGQWLDLGDYGVVRYILECSLLSLVFLAVDALG